MIKKQKEGTTQGPVEEAGLAIVARKEGLSAENLRPPRASRRKPCLQAADRLEVGEFSERQIAAEEFRRSRLPSKELRRRTKVRNLAL